jgi:putative endonuclease
MYHVYLLRSQYFPKLYIGFTSQPVENRLKDHNQGKVKWTSQYRPWRLIYFEGYALEQMARLRERKLKQYGGAWRSLKKRLGLK